MHYLLQHSADSFDVGMLIPNDMDTGSALHLGSVGDSRVPLFIVPACKTNHSDKC